MNPVLNLAEYAPATNILQPISIVPIRHAARIDYAWVAVPNAHQTPQTTFPEAFDENPDTSETWFLNNINNVGVGETPDEALADLLRKAFPGSGDEHYDWGPELSEQEVLTTAFEDACGILTAHLNDTEIGDEDYETTSEHIRTIVAEWEARPCGVLPLIETLAGITAQFVVEDERQFGVNARTRILNTVMVGWGNAS